jgi:hypothetical protein
MREQHVSFPPTKFSSHAHFPVQSESIERTVLKISIWQLKFQCESFLLISAALTFRASTFTCTS